MHNELTRQDLKMMREELDYRRITLRPKLLEAVKEARAFGDLSENFEYKAAKQEKNRNESRIRFLENMIKTAKVFDDTSGADQVGLYDKVTVYMEDDDETEVYQIVTTMRQDVLKGLISKESPVGRSLLGKRVGVPCNTQSIAASNRLVWRKNPSPSGTFPIFKQGLGHISPPGKFLFFRDMSRAASFFLGAQKETKEAPGGRSKWAHAPIFASPWTPFTGAVPLGWHGPSGV